MFNSKLPPLSELPTSAQLVRSTLIAAGAAAALLATVVLPSEYGIDPTGVGNVLGLTQMGKIKVQLAQEDAAGQNNAAVTAASAIDSGSLAAPSTTAAATETVARTDTMEVVLAPGEGAEVKVSAAKGTRVGFEWAVRGGVVNYDTHADAPGVPYFAYGKGKESSGEKGTLVAALDGKHGWFWRNRTGGTVTVVLKTSGGYTAIKRVV